MLWKVLDPGYSQKAVGGGAMRQNLKKARQDAGLTQQAMADKLNISLRHYQRLESGEILGAIDLWDTLEDITGIHQRILREIEATHHDTTGYR